MPRFELKTSDGVSLAARRHRASGGRRSAVVLAHGFTASKDHPEVVAVAESLAGVGHEVISYDSRGHNSSGGLCTLGDAEWMDVAAAAVAARDTHDRVVTVGASMGAIAVLRHGAHDADLAGVVSVSSPAMWRLPRSARAVFASLLTRTRAGRRFTHRKLGVRVHGEWSDPPPPVALAGRIEAPLAVIHGDADRMIPPDAAGQIADAASGISRLDIVSGMHHAFHPLSIPAILDAVDWALGHHPAASAQA